MEREWRKGRFGQSCPNLEQQLEAAGGIEPPYGALQALASNGLTWDSLVA
jgi:hypothetical protein